VDFHGKSLDWRVDMFFLLGWIEDEASLHLFLTDFEQSQAKCLAGYFATAG
jgi:hypothetical protein